MLIHLKPTGFELLPEKFAMTQLQHLYEAIPGVRSDRRKFYAKMQEPRLPDQFDETISLGLPRKIPGAPAHILGCQNPLLGMSLLVPVLIAAEMILVHLT